MELIDTIKKDLKETLSERRYIHSIGVMEMCAKLAQIYGVDVQKAQIAGLLHDIAKEMPKEEMFKYVEENNIEITEIATPYHQCLCHETSFLLQQPDALHSVPYIQQQRLCFLHQRKVTHIFENKPNSDH